MKELDLKEINQIMALGVEHRTRQNQHFQQLADLQDIAAPNRDAFSSSTQNTGFDATEGYNTALNAAL